MAERSVYIYSVAVLIATLFPIHVQNMECENSQSSLIHGKCYRPNMDFLPYTDAKERCEISKGELATFTSVVDMTDVLRELDFPMGYVWIDVPNEPNKSGLKFSANSNGFYSLFQEKCTFKFPSLCVEIDKNNNTKMKDTTLTTTKPATVADLTRNERKTCLHDGSELFDEQCYHLSEKSVYSLNKKNYCTNRNETMLTISTMEQGVKVIWDLVLGSLKHINKCIWVNYQEMFNFAVPTDTDCGEYRFGYASNMDDACFALCIELESTSTTESTTTPKLTTTSEGTTTHELNTKPPATSATESTTTPSVTPGLATSATDSTTTPSVTPRLATISEITEKKEASTTPIGQNQQIIKNRLLPIYRLMTKVEYETRIDLNTRTDYYVKELD